MYRVSRIEFHLKLDSAGSKGILVTRSNHQDISSIHNMMRTHHLLPLVVCLTLANLTHMFGGTVQLLPEYREKLFKDVSAFLDKGNVEGAIQYLSTSRAKTESRPDVEWPGVMANYEAVVMDLYYKRKDIDAVVAVANAGIAFGKKHALKAPEAMPFLPDLLLSSVKSLSYNLASFCWRGWAEEGIELTDTHQKIGLQAAEENLRLAIQLKKPDSAMSNALWLVGAFHLSAKNFGEADKAFMAARELAGKTGDPVSKWMNEGYHGLALMGSDSEQGQAVLTRAMTELQALKDGEFFVGQLKTARRVFFPNH